MLYFIQKRVIWFAVQIKCLFSIWNATFGWNGLRRPYNLQKELTAYWCSSNADSVQLTELKNVSISKWHFVLSFFRHISRTLTSTGKVLSRFYYILRKTRNVQKFRNLESTRLKVSVNHLRLDFHQDFLFDISSELSRNIYEQSEWNTDTTSFSI